MAVGSKAHPPGTVARVVERMVGGKIGSAEEVTDPPTRTTRRRLVVDPALIWVRPYMASCWLGNYTFVELIRIKKLLGLQQLI